MKKRFLSVLLCLCMVLGLVPVTVWAATTSGHTHYLCGSTCSGSGHETESSKTAFATEIKQVGGTLYIDNSKWTVNSSGNYALDGGVYYLSSDIKSDARIQLNGSVTLCLNGHSITANHDDDVIAAAYGVTFTLTDCSKGGAGRITHATTNGGGVYVTGTFNMYGGSITGNKTSSRGGGVCVNGGSFKMFGGSITGNTAAYGGGVGVNGGNSSFTMTGGSITGNNADIGGGVYVSNGTFTMSGGTIGGTGTGEANTDVHGGGGVYVDSGTFTMNDGSITGNSSKSAGGGVYDFGTFNMSGGSITGNNAAGTGGGVYVGSNGTLTMSGGTIGGTGTNEANKAGYGGGVYMYRGNFNMAGGSITGNSSTSSGGGVYVDSGTFTVSGNVNITGNTRVNNSTNNNVYLPENKTITIGGALTEGAKLGVTLDSYYGDKVFTSGWKANMSGKTPADYFISDVDGKGFELSGGEVKLCDGHTHYLCGGSTCNGSGHEEETGKTIFAKEIRQDSTTGKLYIDGTEWRENDFYALDAGSYYLATDLTLNGYIKIQGSVTLCLNGYSITRDDNGNVITVNSNVTFTLTDCKGGNASVAFGKITHASGKIGRGVYMNTRSTFNMYGGSIAGNTVTGDASYAANTGGGVHMYYDGTFNMYGGSIVGNKAPSGGGVYVGGASKFNMSGTASIDRNTADGEPKTSGYLNGGGVYVALSAAFTMTDSASLTNNEATEYGGGVDIGQSGTFKMSGNASITGNTARSGGGVFLFRGAFDMQSGTISGNTATNMGGGVYVNGTGVTFTMTGGTISGNNATTIGGGVYVNSGTFTVSGNVNITGNVIGGAKDSTTGKFTGGTNNNVYLPKGQTITIGGRLTNGAKLGVTVKDADGDYPFTFAWKANMSGKTPADYFISDVGGYKAALDGKELKLVSTHTHSWIYTANGAAITATCKNCEANNGQDFVGGTCTITASDATYDGKVKTAAVSGTGIFENVDMSISYSKYNATSERFESTNILPAGAGKYMASITCGGVTAGVEYTIGKAKRIDTPDSLTVSPAGSVGGKGKINGTTSAADNSDLAMEYNTSADATVGWKDCTSGSTEVAPGTYYVRYKESRNYLASGVSAALTVKEHTHSGGNATCKNKAVCDGCGQEYGELGNHNFTETVDGKYLVSAATCGSKAVYNKSCSVCGAKSTETFENGEFDYKNHIGSTYKKNQKEATCYAEGYTGDIYCSTCNHEIEKGTPIAKNDHNPASVWTTDQTDHWKECQTVGCGNIIDKAHHSGGEATCVKKAICSVCKVEYGAVDSSNHKHTEVRGAKDATCCEKGYTGDKWCTDCNTKVENGNEIPATGNHTDVDGKWESDGTNHWHTCSHGFKFDVTAHNGGEATCITKANCSVCGSEYGSTDDSNHKHTEVRGAKDATCCEKGYTGDTWCIDCNKIIENGSEIAATGNHTDVDGKWESDETNHWHTCYFGTKFDVTAHNGGEATCKNQAECSECGHSYGSFDASNHKGTTYLKNQKEATCYDEGYTGDTYCSDCNEKIADGQSIAKNAHNPASVWSTDEHDHWKECQTVGCGNVIDKAAHSGGEATCVSKAVCEVCKAQYGDIDAANHKHTEIRNAKPATEQEKGYTGDTWCTDCNKKIADGKETDILSHSLKKVEAKAATTRENGNIEYFYCAGCGKYFADQDATKEITLAQTVLEKLKGNEESPKTGDDNMVAVWSLAAILSLAVLGYTIVVLKKKRAK